MPPSSKFELRSRMPCQNAVSPHPLQIIHVPPTERYLARTLNSIRNPNGRESFPRRCDDGRLTTSVVGWLVAVWVENEGWADSGEALTRSLYPRVRTAPHLGHVQCMRARASCRVHNPSVPTSVTVVSLPVKGFAHSIARAPMCKKEFPRNLHSKSLISPAYSRARPSAPSSDRRAAALTSPKDQLNRERWRRRRRLFRVSCGRELTGTRALIEKGKRYYTHHGVETAHVRALGMSDRERNQD